MGEEELSLSFLFQQCRALALEVPTPYPTSRLGLSGDPHSFSLSQILYSWGNLPLFPRQTPDSWAPPLSSLSYSPPLPPPGRPQGRPPAARPSSRRGYSGTGALPRPPAAGAQASGGGGDEARCQSRALNFLSTLESSPSPCVQDLGPRDSRRGRP